LQVNEPVINRDGISTLIHAAEAKIGEFQDKVKRIDSRVEQLEGDRDAVEALVEYLSKASERKSLLTGLFVREFEYGSGDEVPPEIVDYYSARLASRVSRIEQLRNLRKEREQGIAFTESDIGLLKKAYSIQDWSVYLDAAVDDY
jgi:hypothetical protein